MVQKGEIVSLSIFVLVVGLLLGSAVSGVLVEEPYEQYDEGQDDFTDEQGNSSGTMTASVLMGYYGPNGEPVATKQFGQEFRTFMLRQPVTRDEVLDFKALVDDVQIDAVGIKSETLRVKVALYIEYYAPPGQARPGTILKVMVHDYNLNAGHFSGIESDRVNFRGNTKLDYPMTARLSSWGDSLQIPYQVDGYEWMFRVQISAHAETVNGDTITADPFNEDMPMVTDIDWEALTPTPSLRVSGSVSGRSLLPSTSQGLSVIFVFVVLSVYLWYKWGRKLIHGT